MILTVPFTTRQYIVKKRHLINCVAVQLIWWHIKTKSSIRAAKDITISPQYQTVTRYRRHRTRHRKIQGCLIKPIFIINDTWDYISPYDRTKHCTKCTEHGHCNALIERPFVVLILGIKNMYYVELGTMFSMSYLTNFCIYCYMLYCT